MIESHHKNCLIIRLQGGLGNQMFQYAFGRSLALKTSRKLYFETYRLERDKQRYLMLDRFNTTLKFVSPMDRLCLKAMRKKAFYWPAFALLKSRHGFQMQYFREKSIQCNPQIFELQGNLILDGYWASYQYFQEYDAIIRQELKLNTPIPDCYCELAKQIQSTQAVALHVRRGDYVTDPGANKRHGLCPIIYYQAAVRRIQEQVEIPKFFVFSDDPDWVNSHLEIGTSFEVVRADASVGDVEDLRLMTLCKHFITANSTFSWWGAWLGEYADKKVIVPEQWFTQRTIHSVDLLPKGWLAM